MSFDGSIRALFLVVSMVLVDACTATPGGQLPNALSSFVVWSDAQLDPAVGADGQPLDLIHVRGGEVLRIQLHDAAPVRVGERFSTGLSLVDSWSVHVPVDSMLLLRTSALADALVLPRGVAVRAYHGHGSDPGYAWFELEDRVLAWANGPLPAPFPSVAPRERLAFDGFAALDQVLAEALSHSSDRETALTAVRAVRAVAGLRAIRALRPPTGLPYFLETAVRASPEAEGLLGARAAYRVSKGMPLELPATGPKILHIWIQSPATAREPAELTVLEGNSIRGHAQLTAPRLPLTSRDAPAPGANPAIRVQRAIVHVPPGFHHYRLESTADVLVAPVLAEPIVHVEDTARKDETLRLAQAKRACEHPDAAPICALTLALLGLDGAAHQPDGTLSQWGAALTAASELTQHLAAELARGGPSDPMLELERSGSRGQPAALEALAASASQSVDGGFRAAWVHALAQGTEWRVAEAESDALPWLSVAAEASSSPDRCPSNGLADAAEVTDVEGEYQTGLWHGVPTVELVVTSQCSDPRPVELMVDGQRVIANPSSPLARWHIRVRGDGARMRRVDHSRASVLALRAGAGQCRKRWEALRASVVAAAGPVLRLGPEPGEAGLELWLRAGASRADVDLTDAEAGLTGGRSVHLTAARSLGFTAYDAAGVLWTRVARLPLPAWAKGRIRATGGSEVAVRALVRVARGERKASTANQEPVPSVPLDEAALAEMTRRILAEPPLRRGPLYLERALILAVGGARGGALADARVARQLGSHGPHQEDPLELVQAALRRLPLEPDPLPEGVNAYGIESDFETDAKKCTLTEGARAQLERLSAASGQATPDPASPSSFDAIGAARAVALSEQVPLDPRSHRLVSRALSGSRWKLRRETGEAPQRVRRPSAARREGPVDADGDLRPRVLVGGRFAAGSYATVQPAHSAQAVVAGIPRGAHARVDLACAAREPSLATLNCPIAVLLDDKPLAVEMGDDGHATIDLPESLGRRAHLVTSLRDEPGEWVALVRLVVDRPLPNALQVDETHWAIAPRPAEWRTILKPGAKLTLADPAPALLRVDARTEAQGPAVLVIVIDGHERVVPADGRGVAVPVAERAAITLSARGGPISVAVAERVPNGLPVVPVAAPARAARQSGEEPTPIALGPRPEPDGSQANWFQLALHSPPPLTPLEAALGTLVAETGVASGKLHKSDPSSTWADAYAFTLLGYRRRLEPLGLWTRAELFSRIRSGDPTYGAEGSLYEDLEHAHVRLTGSVKVEAQQVAGIRSRSLIARGFAEYSYRAASKFFVLPRLGYDGMYSSVARRPTSLAYVDDEIYSPYRARRPTFLFAQALFWFAPYFNEILYLRLRGTFDAKAQRFSHSAASVGTFLAFGDLDLSGETQAVWYVPRDALTNSAHVGTLTGIVARYSLWSGLGSLVVVPGVAAVARPEDAAWQVTGFVNVFASLRRGLRDFSSLELDFPEQLSGGIPWRGATPGGYR